MVRILMPDVDCDQDVPVAVHFTCNRELHFVDYIQEFDIEPFPDGCYFHWIHRLIYPENQQQLLRVWRALCLQPNHCRYLGDYQVTVD